MINKDMYSLCIDIHNKLFTGKLHFASCQVWSIKVICKDFTWIYRAENLTTHLHLNYCLRANPLEYVLCSRLIAIIWFLVILIHKFLVLFQHWTFFEVESISMQRVTGISKPPCMRSLWRPRCLGTLRTLGQYVPNLNLFQFVWKGCSSVSFFLENKMTLTTLSWNLMIFYHFLPLKSGK